MQRRSTEGKRQWVNRFTLNYDPAESEDSLGDSDSDKEETQVFQLHEGHKGQRNPDECESTDSESCDFDIIESGGIPIRRQRRRQILSTKDDKNGNNQVIVDEDTEADEEVSEDPTLEEKIESEEEVSEDPHKVTEEEVLEESTDDDSDDSEAPPPPISVDKLKWRKLKRLDNVKLVNTAYEPADEQVNDK